MTDLPLAVKALLLAALILTLAALGHEILNMPSSDLGHWCERAEGVVVQDAHGKWQCVNPMWKGHARAASPNT